MLPLPAPVPPSPAAAGPDDVPRPDLPPPASRVLPARPRLRRPALHRATDARQFGIDPPGALVLEGLTPPLARMVDGLDGTRPAARVLAEAVAAGASPGAARDLLDRLHAAGLLADAPVPGHRPGADDEAGRGGRRVVVHGAGRVAVAVACLLAAAGVGRVLVEARGTVTHDDVGTGLLAGDVGRPALRAAQEAVARVAGITAVGDRPAARRWFAAHADLVILADGARPDPVLAARLTVAGRAHLPVAVVEGTGLVGPLVVPGHTPCLRCDDLARTDADPAWPRVAAGLAAWRPPVPVAQAAAIAALAVAQALDLLDGAAAGPAARGAVLALADDGTRTRDPRRRHPCCGCDALAGRPGRDHRARADREPGVDTAA